MNKISVAFGKKVDLHPGKVQWNGQLPWSFMATSTSPKFSDNTAVVKRYGGADDRLLIAKTPFYLRFDLLCFYSNTTVIFYSGLILFKRLQLSLVTSWTVFF